MITTLSPMQRVVRSRIFLLREYPFFGTLALYLQLEEDPNIGTAATDGKKLYYNPEFIKGLTEPELNFLILHEVLHPALGHLWRKGNRNHEKWNFATDYAINAMIKELNSSHFELIKDALYDEKYAGKFAEEIYELLPDVKKLHAMFGGHDSGKRGSHKTWGKGSGDGDDQEQGKGYNTDETEWKSRVTNAAIQFGDKMKGNMPAALKRLIKQYTNPQKNWREELADFVSYEVFDYSFSPTDRRFVHADLLLPDFNDEVETIKDLVVAVDTSGSISDRELAVALGEIKGLLDQFNGVTGHLMYFDAEVAAVYPLEEFDQHEPKGGGGTDFRPIFKWIDEKELDCVGCIVITDLYGTFPTGKDVPTKYPVLWVTERDMGVKVPFGRVTYFKQ